MRIETDEADTPEDSPETRIDTVLLTPDATQYELLDSFLREHEVQELYQYGLNRCHALRRSPFPNLTLEPGHGLAVDL